MAKIAKNADAGTEVKGDAKPARTRKTAAKPGKAGAAKTAGTPKGSGEALVATMRGGTRLVHAGGGEQALAALHPAIDALNASGEVLVSAAAHQGDVVNVHLVPAGHKTPYDANPGVVLAIGANGLAAFDHVPIGLATPELMRDAVLSVMEAVRPVEGEGATPLGRGVGWHARACLAAGAVAERFAST